MRAPSGKGRGYVVGHVSGRTVHTGFLYRHGDHKPPYHPYSFRKTMGDLSWLLDRYPEADVNGEAINYMVNKEIDAILSFWLALEPDAVFPRTVAEAIFALAKTNDTKALLQYLDLMEKSA